MIERVTAWAQSPIVGFVLIAVFVLIVVAFNMARTYHLETLRNFFRNKERFAFADSNRTLLSGLLLALCAIMSYSVFFTIVFNRYLPIVLLVSIGAVVVWLLIQWLALIITGYCANVDAQMQQFLRAFFLTFVLFGILLYPITVGLVYAPQNIFLILTYIGYTIVAVGFIVLIVKSMQLFFTGFDTTCYLFLYLCTLEIMPVLLLKKVADWLMQDVLF